MAKAKRIKPLDGFSNVLDAIFRFSSHYLAKNGWIPAKILAADCADDADGRGFGAANYANAANRGHPRHPRNPRLRQHRPRSRQPVGEETGPRRKGNIL